MKKWLKILSLIREKEEENLIGPIGISNYNDDGLDSLTSIAPGVLQQMKLNSFRC